MDGQLSQSLPRSSSKAQEGSRSRLRPFRIWGTVWRLLLLLILFLTFFPFIFMLISSLKDTHQFYNYFWGPAWPLHFENYQYALTDMARALGNSLFVTVLSIVGILINACLAGFIFARYRFPGREFLFYAMIAMMMIPGVLMLVPSFVWVKELGLIDTYWVMILPYISGGQILGIFLLRSFFAQISRDLYEAAEVDGAGLFRQLIHIGMPLAKPVIGTVAIISALGVWNNYLWPLVTTSSEEIMVLTIYILRYESKLGGQYGKMFAGYTVSAIPLAILFLVATRAFMRGITSGALKG